MKKVTAKQLMIGDWVRYKRQYRQVKALNLKDFFGNMTIELSVYPEATVTSATPIPITEEWLKLNGFTTGDSNVIFAKYVTLDLAITFFTSDNSVYITESKDGLIKDTGHFSSCCYIHQLQQAYRLATGKELKVKF